MTTKTCSTCKEQKILNPDNFVLRDKNKQTYHSQCKLCRNTRRKFKDKDLCHCGSIKSKRAKQCQKCVNQESRNISLNLTIGEKTYKKHLYAKYQYVRYYARQLGIEAGFKCCAKCGYNKHFEVCHIKPVASYPPETTIAEINRIENLLPLCPNCHWELDNGIK